MTGCNRCRSGRFFVARSPKGKDLFVDGRPVFEFKSVKGTTGEHVALLLGYRKSSRIETGWLIDFGASKLYIKKYVMTPKE